MLHVLYPLAAAAGEGNKVEELVQRFGIDWPYLLSQVISFAIVAFLLYKFAFKPVLATIEERQRRIADGLRYADEMKARLADTERQQAETLRQAALEAQRIVHEARAAAKDLLDRETAQATEKAQQMIARAEEAIELERRKMVADVREEITDLVVLTASKVLSRDLSSDERRRFSESAARELSSV